MKIHTEWLSVSCEPRTFFYGFSPSESKFKAELKQRGVKEHVEYFGKEATTHVFSRGNNWYVIVTISSQADKVDPAMAAMLLVHEASHVCDFFMQHIGEDTPSKEFKAYTLQRIAGELIAAYEHTRRPLFRKGKKRGRR